MKQMNNKVHLNKSMIRIICVLIAICVITIICFVVNNMFDNKTSFEPTPIPTFAPTPESTPIPTLAPTSESTPIPTLAPTTEPTPIPTLIPTPEPTPELTDFERINNKIILENVYSDKMADLVELAKNYLDESYLDYNGKNADHYGHPITSEYEGGIDLTHDEYLEFCRNVKNRSYDDMLNIYGEYNFLRVPEEQDPAYQYKRIDLDNCGVGEIVLNSRDTGSSGDKTFTDVYKLNDNMEYEFFFQLSFGIYHSVEYNETAYLVYPHNKNMYTANPLTRDTAINIVHLNGNKMEAYQLTKESIRELEHIDLLRSIFFPVR